MKTIIRTLDSLFLLCLPIWILYRDLQIPLGGLPIYIKCFQMTHLSLFLCVIYYIIILVHDVKNMKNELKQLIVPNGQEIFYQLALTATILAALLFWGLWAIDPTLVTTEHMIKIKPRWLDVALHGGTALILYIDNISHLHMWKQRVSTDVLTMGLFAIFNLCLQKVYSITFNEEIYGFQEKMGLVGRGMLYLGFVGVGVIIGLFCRRATVGLTRWKEGSILRIRQSVDFSVEGGVIDTYAQ